MIPEKDIAILQRVGAVASELGLDCYAVGGYVRDCFLKRHSKDIDFVTVGSGIDLASAVARMLGKGAHLAVFRILVRHRSNGMMSSLNLSARVARAIRMIRVSPWLRTELWTMIYHAVILRSMRLP